MGGNGQQMKPPGGGRRQGRLRRRRLKLGPAQADAAMEPSPWRMQHHPLDEDGPALSRAQISNKDGAGPASYPMRATDTVQALLNKGRIDDHAAAGAQKFEAIFQRASLSGLASRDIRRIAGPFNPGHNEPYGILRARDDVWEAMRALGGINTPGASIAWDVLGLGITIKAHAERCQFGNGRSLNPMTATGILVQSCFTLAVHFGK